MDFKEYFLCMPLAGRF